jgi:hypothetical protein
VKLKSEDFAYTSGNWHLWQEEIDHRPLRSRGWVVRELVLSPRVLHSGKHQMFWDCAELRACESLPTGPPPKFSKYSEDIRVIGPGLLPSTDQPPRSIARLAEDIDFLKALKWMTLVEEYSACSLTVPSDKLVAISGLAKSLNHNCQYLAGIGSTYLPLQMLWRASLEARNKSHDFKFYTEYQAPTWSWASMKVKIEFPMKEKYDDSKDMVSVLGGHVLLASDDPTGKVSGGFLHLQGPLILIRTELLYEGPFYDMTLKSQSLLGTLNFDHNKIGITGSGTLYLLPVSGSFDYYSGYSGYLGKGEFQGIIIEPTSKAIGQFYRRGYFQGHTQSDLKIQCIDAVSTLKGSEYESVELHANFGYVVTITLI